MAKVWDRRKRICPTCGIDLQFRALFQEKLIKAEAAKLKAEAAAQEWRRRYENKRKVADSLTLRLARENPLKESSEDGSHDASSDSAS